MRVKAYIAWFAGSCAVGATWQTRLNDHEICMLSEDFQISVEKAVAMTIQYKI